MILGRQTFWLKKSFMKVSIEVQLEQCKGRRYLLHVTGL